VLPVEHDATEKPAASVLDGPLGSNVRRDVLRVRLSGTDSISVVRMLALRAVVAMAERNDDGLSQVVLEADGKRIRVVGTPGNHHQD